MQTSFDPLHPLQSTIVEVLAKRPNITVAALHAELLSRGMDVSLPNLYRVVTQLTDAQMLVRNRGALALNLVWVSSIARFFETVRDLYLSAGEQRELPAKDGERREYQADSLAGLDPIWNHVLTRMAESAKGGEWYEYASHPYFYLGLPDTETRFYSGLGDRKVTCRVLHGNDSVLDRHGDRLSAMNGATTVIAEDTPFPKEGFVLIVYGDYVVECVFPDDIARHFAYFFRSVSSMDQFDPELFAQVFRMKAKCRISVRKSAREAQSLRAKFLPFFPGGKR